jgi:hypothetical protein
MDARLKAAEAILEKGVRFRLPAPFYKKWFKKDFVSIHPLKAGTILEISRIVLENKLEDAIAMGDYEFLLNSVDPCAQCIAIAILNDKKKIERENETGKLKNKLLWMIADTSLLEIFLKVLLMNRVSDFMNITKFFVMTMRTMMNPKNLGQDENGS